MRMFLVYTSSSRLTRQLRYEKVTCNGDIVLVEPNFSTDNKNKLRSSPNSADTFTMLLLRMTIFRLSMFCVGVMHEVIYKKRHCDQRTIKWITLAELKTQAVESVRSRGDGKIELTQLQDGCQSQEMILEIVLTSGRFLTSGDDSLYWVNFRTVFDIRRWFSRLC
jgi:hypothetical protein